MRTNVFTAVFIALVLSAATVTATTVPGTGSEESSPELVTPEVPSFGATSPEIGTPATCEMAFCTEETPTGPLVIPENDWGCVPSDDAQILCVRNDEVPLSEGETAPAVCTAISAACQPGTVLVPEEHHETPGVPPMTILTEGHARITYGVDDTVIEDPSVEVRTIQDYEISVGPLHFKACQTPCPYPHVNGGGLTSGVTLVLDVDGNEFGGYFPLVP